LLEEVFDVFGCGGEVEELAVCKLRGVLGGLVCGADGGHVEGRGDLGWWGGVKVKGSLRGGDECWRGDGGVC
jgi:hypothetical protein